MKPVLGFYDEGLGVGEATISPRPEAGKERNMTREQGNAKGQKDHPL